MLSFAGKFIVSHGVGDFSQKYAVYSCSVDSHSSHTCSIVAAQISRGVRAFVTTARIGPD